jgi:hypothetical protein
MKIIPPHKVTAQLLDIIHEAEQELILVSPYVDFTSWQKPVAAIKSAIARGVKVTFYIRSNQDSQASRHHVEQLGLAPVLVENLHAKMYLSEKDGILTSMNLLRYSDSNSIEIGTQVEKPEELTELRRIVDRFIAQTAPAAPATPLNTSPLMAQDASVHAFDESLEQYLHQHVDRNAYVEWTDDTILNISALNNSFTFQMGQPSIKAVVEGIISSREAERFPVKHQRHFNDAAMQYKIVDEPGSYIRVRGINGILFSARNPDELPNDERQRLHSTIATFVRAVRAFKDDWK